MSKPRLIAVVALLLSSIAVAQASAAAPKDPYGPRGGLTALLKKKAVQAELKLTEKQQAFANALKPAKGDNLAAIKKSLEKSQQKRLHQLSWQARGGYVLFGKFVASKLSITEDQQEKLAAAAKVNVAEHAKMRDFLRRARFRSREAMQKYIAGYRDAADKRLLDVLTAAQKKSLKALLGKPLAA